jgi:hypothetical protein
VTSPSGRSLLGTTTGTATYDVAGQPPQATSDPPGWDFFLGNARYSTLENGQASIQVATRTLAQAGTAMEMWLYSGDSTALHWEGGDTRAYNGVFCFQLRLEDEGESLHLEDAQYHLTVAFRDLESGGYRVVKDIRVAGTPPELDGETPGPDSRVGTELLGCPRSVI